jgi:hypothetical protein
VAIGGEDGVDGIFTLQDGALTLARHQLVKSSDDPASPSRRTSATPMCDSAGKAEKGPTASGTGVTTHPVAA